MLKLIGTTLIFCALAALPAGAQTQDAATRQQERQSQEQAERERKQAERERKEREKDARKEPGSRCARWKSGKA